MTGIPKILPRRDLMSGEVIEREELPEPPKAERQGRRNYTKRPVDHRRQRDQPNLRSEAYKEYVRSHRCCGCDRSASPTQSEAHHWEKGMHGRGQKVSDFRTVPLCIDCHTRWHTEGSIFARGEKPDMVRHTYALGLSGRRASELVFTHTMLELLVAWAQVQG